MNDSAETKATVPDGAGAAGEVDQDADAENRRSLHQDHSAELQPSPCRAGGDSTKHRGVDAAWLLGDAVVVDQACAAADAETEWGIVAAAAS